MVNIKEKFKNQISVQNGVKKKNIILSFKRLIKLDGKILDYQLYKIILADKRFERDLLIKKILE
jgi:hypothetical protein